MPVEYCSKCGSDNIITAQSQSEKNYGRWYEKCGVCGNFEAWVGAPAGGSRGRGGGRGSSGYSRGGSGGPGYIPRQNQHVNQGMLPPKRQRPQQALDYGNDGWGEEWQNEDDSHYAEVEEPEVSSSSSSSSSSSAPAVRHQPGHPTSKMQPDSAISLILAAYRDALNVQDRKFDELQKTNASLLALVKELSQSVADLSQQIAQLTASK